MRIRLTDERHAAILAALTHKYSETFDQELSPYRAEQLLEFFVKNLGAPIYNQAIQDARRYMADKLDELDADFYETEEPL